MPPNGGRLPLTLLSAPDRSPMDIPPQDTTSINDLNQRFTLACEAQAAGRLDEAREHYLLLLHAFPQVPLLHYNIGLVYYGLHDFHLALQAVTRASVLTPEDVDTLFNLALCEKKTGDCQAAIATYRRLLAIRPDHADGWYNLAGCYRQSHDQTQALHCYHRVLAIDPAYLSAANNLAYLYHRAGEIDQAAIYYRQVLAVRPGDESIRYLLASLLGTPLDHAPDAYVRDFFDTYAEGFEQSLVGELGYDNPRQLYDCFCNCPGHRPRYGHGLDLGCGTGLGGLPFGAVVAVLDGVDLSPNMLIQAAAKGCYATLYPDSISHHLGVTAETYDFFLATDVFIYVGALEETFAAAHAIARPAALFCFSTEHLAGVDYHLQTTGRFAYSPAYIQRIAAATGWAVLALEPTRLRREGDGWIAGDLWILQRTAVQH